MSNDLKNQRNILDKLGIEALNPMQIEAQHSIHSANEVVLLSPTGTGKTIAFLLPLIAELDPEVDEVQLLILAPSRELAIQIEQVIREMGAGYKANAVYGGRNFSKDKIDLKHRPAILIGTPGRVADHIRRKTFSTEYIHFLVLDEFDKSLEIGFEEEMKEIILELTQLKKKVLTSATQKIDIPAFVGISEPTLIDFSSDGIEKLNITRVTSPDKDKLEALGKLINHLNGQQGIVFCNFKSSIQRVSEYLHDINIDHGCFYGGMEQQDRERALIKFRNGTHNIIVATDLAARGIDVPEINFIIHYHLPLRANEFTHRNGRTARMHSEGTAYVLHWEEEDLPDFIQVLGIDAIPVDDLELSSGSPSFSWQTLFISGGRKDKISKGDIAGLFFKQAELKKDELGVIELKQDCAFVAVPTSKVEHVIKMVDNSRLKKKKVRVRKI